MKTMILGLMAFVHAETGLPIPAEMPVVSYQPRCTIQQTFGQRCGDRGVMAYYGNGAIVIDARQTPDTVIGKSILLHEIVHYMQHAAGAPRTERQAYRTQIAYIRFLGENPCRFDGPLAIYAGCN